MSRRVLITGISGFIGTNFYLEWQRRFPEDKIYGFDNFFTGDILNLSQFKGNFISADLRDYDWLLRIKDIKPDLIFHFAANAITTDFNPLSQSLVNVDAFRNLLAVAAEDKTPIIWTSSAAVYGQKEGICKEDDELFPNSPYAVSKMLAERLVEECLSSEPDWKIITIRPFNIWGPFVSHKGEMACYIHQMIEQVKKYRSVRLFKDGSQKRDFCHISDLVSLMINASIKLEKGTILNGGSGIATSYNEIVDLLTKYMEYDGEIVWADDKPSHFQAFTQADTSKAYKLLGWAPKISLDKGIEAMLS